MTSAPRIGGGGDRIDVQVGGVVGTFALGSIIDRFSFRALALVYFVACRGRRDRPARVTRRLRHHWRSSPPAFALSGGQIAANALAATFYRPR